MSGIFNFLSAFCALSINVCLSRNCLSIEYKNRSDVISLKNLYQLVAYKNLRSRVLTSYKSFSSYSWTFKKPNKCINSDALPRILFKSYVLEACLHRLLKIFDTHFIFWFYIAKTILRWLFLILGKFENYIAYFYSKCGRIINNYK